MPDLPKLDMKWTCLVCRCDQTSGRRCRVISRDQGQLTLHHATEIPRVLADEQLPFPDDKLGAIERILDEVYDDVICSDCDVGAARKERDELRKALFELQDWAEFKWDDEVKHRPVENIYRKTLDATWGQVKRRIAQTIDGLDFGKKRPRA